MTKRDCATCGGRFEAKTVRNKYCSGRCRTRAYRVTPTAAQPLAASASPDGQYERAVRRELDEVGRAESVLGLQALGLARELDAGRNSGSVITQLNRELRAVMAAAMIGASAKDDRVDELGERRRSRLHG